MLALVIVGLFAFAAGAIYGRTGLRREQRQPAAVVQPHRLHIAWRNPDSTRKS